MIAAAGCMAARELAFYEDRPARFPHQVHIEEAFLECSNCHGEVAAAEKAEMPQKDQCLMCHEEERPMRFAVGGEVRWSNVTALPADITFAHSRHLGAGLTCAECHTGIETSTQVNLDLRVDMDRCRACHEERGVGQPDPGDPSRGCGVCHKEIRADQPPVTHRQNWLARHGQIVRGGAPTERVYDCTLCHHQSDCAACHRDTPPSSHTTQWAQMSHGIAAGINRSYCMACHRPDACQRCHEETPPRTHTASWGLPTNRHCTVCHFPMDNERCFLCHTRTASHGQAPPRPAWHFPTMNCRQCHTPTSQIRLPHPDPGMACTHCHL